MAKVRCWVTLSGEPDKYVSAIKAIHQYTNFGIAKSRDVVISLSEIPSATVRTETKKNAVALVKELSDCGIKANWKGVVK